MATIKVQMQEPVLAKNEKGRQCKAILTRRVMVEKV